MADRILRTPTRASTGANKTVAIGSMPEMREGGGPGISNVRAEFETIAEIRKF